MILSITFSFLFSCATGKQLLTGQKDADFYLKQGNAYAVKGQYDQAISAYTEAIRINSNFAKAYNNRGHAYWDKRQHEQAIYDYNKAIETDPTFANAYNNRGYAICEHEGRDDQGFSDFNKAIEINPRLAEAYNNRAEINLKGQSTLKEDLKDRLHQAFNDYNKAVEIDPNFALAFYNRGSLYAMLGDYDQAVASFTKAIEVKPDFGDAYFMRAAFNERDPDKREKDLEKGLKLSDTLSSHLPNLIRTPLER